MLTLLQMGKRNYGKSYPKWNFHKNNWKNGKIEDTIYNKTNLANSLVLLKIDLHKN